MRAAMTVINLRIANKVNKKQNGKNCLKEEIYLSILYHKNGFNTEQKCGKASKNRQQPPILSKNRTYHAGLCCWIVWVLYPVGPINAVDQY